MLPYFPCCFNKLMSATYLPSTSINPHELATNIAKQGVKHHLVPMFFPGLSKSPNAGNVLEGYGQENRPTTIGPRIELSGN